MSERDVPPLAPALQELLAAERQRPGLAPPALERIAARVATLGPVPLPADGWAQRLIAHKGATVAAAFVAGAVAGGGLVAALDRRARAPVAHEQRAAPPPPAAESPAPMRGEPPAVTPAAPALFAPPASTEDRAPVRKIARPARERAQARAPDSERDVALAAERAPLETARTALARGQAAAALAALTEHERLFPAGRLAEERDALRVQALVRVERFAEARERATAFRRRFPSSFLLPAVDAAVGQIP